MLSLRDKYELGRRALAVGIKQAQMLKLLDLQSRRGWCTLSAVVTQAPTFLQEAVNSGFPLYSAYRLRKQPVDAIEKELIEWRAQTNGKRVSGLRKIQDFLERIWVDFVGFHRNVGTSFVGSSHSLLTTVIRLRQQVNLVLDEIEVNCVQQIVSQPSQPVIEREEKKCPEQQCSDPAGPLNLLSSSNSEPSLKEKESLSC